MSLARGGIMAITRERLKALLGVTDVALALRGVTTEERAGYRLERINFTTRGGDTIRGLLTRPIDLSVPAPAIVYAHAHGARYDIGASELIEGRPELLGPLGPIFAHAGYVTLAIDMPTFGERSGVTESAASKAAVWYGKSLFGQMLSEQAGAIGYLASRSDVDQQHIGMFGLSMGSILTYWLAAVDQRIAAAAHLCCFADFATMVASGAHDGHGHYLTVPGLLAETSTGEIGGMVAPRPQLICLGNDDALTPPLAVERALAETVAAYAAANASRALEVHRQPGGHAETAQMRDAVLHFFARTLRAGL